MLPSRRTGISGEIDVCHTLCDIVRSGKATLEVLQPLKVILLRSQIANQTPLDTLPADDPMELDSNERSNLQPVSPDCFEIRMYKFRMFNVNVV